VRIISLSATEVMVLSLDVSQPDERNRSRKSLKTLDVQTIVNVHSLHGINAVIVFSL